MEITKDAMNAVSRYFHTLSNLGYKKNTEVDKLLVYLFLEELLCGVWSQFITDKDYKDIDRALYCFYGTSCMMPYPIYKETYYSNVVIPTFNKYRISEDAIIRKLEIGSIRTAT